MYIFELPSAPAVSQKEHISVAEDYDWRSRVHLPISKEMVQELSVGDEVTFTITGKVFSTEARENEAEEGTKENNEVGLRVSVVKTAGKNEFEELAED